MTSFGKKPLFMVCFKFVDKLEVTQNIKLRSTLLSLASLKSCLNERFHSIIRLHLYNTPTPVIKQACNYGHL